jgi:hypothetical protein
MNEMTDIKFRVWDKKDKMFIRPGIVGPPQVFTLWTWNPNRWIDQEGKDSINDYVFQFAIGQHDIKGNEIFQGDIVSCYWWFDGEQTRPEEKSALEVNAWIGSSIDARFTGGYDGVWHFEDVEILGNICENPELMEDVAKSLAADPPAAIEKN